MKKRALLSVSDKRGIEELAKGLVELGYEIVSTGGTARKLQEAGVAVTPVSDVTGFPEILEGRVKTLHPRIHGGLLAKRNEKHLAELTEHEITPIDLVVVNLYPFKETVSKESVTLDEALENIDIGGPTMIRAAAKNFPHVTVVVKPERYEKILETLKEKGMIDEKTRMTLALEAFQHTAQYDSYIVDYLSKVKGNGESFILRGVQGKELRYGENPHQSAKFYKLPEEGGLANARQVQGKELSFNNIVDINAALGAVQEFEEPAAVIVKHTNPCGVAVSEDILSAYDKAFAADPVSAFGGIVALNREIDERLADKLTATFLEAVIAPGCTKGAREILAKKPNLRVLELADMGLLGSVVDLKKVQGGFLLQDMDKYEINPEDLKQVSGEPLTESEINELLFAWKVVKHVKSNAIVVTKDNSTLGIGAGQMNRVGAAQIALEQAGEKAKGAFLASDAFFPFKDTVDLAAKYEIKAIIQPGGSMRDEESIKAAQASGIKMVFTGVRHFKH
ncbi:MAG: phosphoribosylaminoimidazolecarboxamide formyltransferase / cyclohydrolase [Clostridia bacterium]|nr:phosphoribosylaminoimidazolecarboxamide formyltransferase/IMP cyclohydrolase [Clostridiales bacterium]MDK2985963.1 phosphoribosylaminoimidazolecarboxamide formyltransferase / cyclohydrolase [Clostridia bacterium]